MAGVERGREELEVAQQRAGIDLFGQRCAVHWTGPYRHSDVYADEALAAIMRTGYLEEDSSFTTSLDLSFPVDNHAPVGLVFSLSALLKLGYRHLDLNEKGRTPMELVYELNYGRRVSLNLLVGVVSYNVATLRDAYEHLLVDGFTWVKRDAVRRPRYDLFAFPRQWAHLAGDRYQIVDLPELT